MATWDEMVVELEEDEASFLRQASNQYRNELRHLKEKLSRCSEKTETERGKQRIYRTMFLKDMKQIQKMNKKVEENQKKIRSLKNRLSHVLTSDRNKLHLPTTHVDPDLITFKTRTLLAEIKEDMLDSQKTGRFENINARIAEVRKLFNLCMIQLDDLNEQNKIVSGVLDCLIRLDVRKSMLFFLRMTFRKEKLNFFSFFIQETEASLRDLKEKYSRKIPKIIVS